MGAQANALQRNIDLSPIEPGYLAKCVRSDNLLFTSGHTSDLKGVLGSDLTVDQGYEAAKDSAAKILRSVHDLHGTLDGLSVVRLLGAVYSAPDFTDQPDVMNGASDLMLDIFGPALGRHARSALGFSALPNGAAVEIEAIFRIE